MRASGRVVAQILAAVREQAKSGTRLAELDDVARAVLAGAGATSPFLGYRPGFAPVPFPAVICASVNDAALHGIPGERELTDGDLLSVDCGAVLDGWAADAAVSFTIGPPQPGDARLIATTEAALHAGIAAAVPGARIGDISAAIGAAGRAVTASAPISVATASAGPCMRIRTFPTRAGRAAAAVWRRGWSSRSSRGSWPAARTATTSTRTAGPSAAATAAGPPTPSTPWPSPPTARRYSPCCDRGRRSRRAAYDYPMLQEALRRAARSGPEPDGLLPGRLGRLAT